MKKFALITGILVLGSVFLVQRAIAAGCTNSYGASVECPTTGIEINKKVAYPGNPYLFVENLTVNDPAYTPVIRLNMIWNLPTRVP
jgi:hypothetical protein